MKAKKCNPGLFRAGGLLTFALIFMLAACRRDFVPKPRGYFRIDLPEHAYQVFESDCPYRFEYPVYCRVIPLTGERSEPCWVNINYPDLNGNIHLSYKTIDNNLEALLEDSRTLVYKHTIKADAITEQVFLHDDRKVYGILYDIEGNAASNLQFFATDSLKHFLRGALYFAAEPNADSLRPVISFVRQDIVRLLQSLEWK